MADLQNLLASRFSAYVYNYSNVTFRNDIESFAFVVSDSIKTYYRLKNSLLMSGNPLLSFFGEITEWFKNIFRQSYTINSLTNRLEFKELETLYWSILELENDVNVYEKLKRLYDESKEQILNLEAENKKKVVENLISSIGKKQGS